MPPVIPNATIDYLIDKYKIDRTVLTPTMIRQGIRAEMEHRDIIGNDIEKAFRIALAHWNETDNRYYPALKAMEKRLKQGRRY